MFFVNYNIRRLHISSLSGCPGHFFRLIAYYWTLRSLQWFFVCCRSIRTFNQTVPFLSGRRFHLDTLSSVGQLEQNKDSYSSAKVFQPPGSTAFQGPWAQGENHFLTDSYELFTRPHTNPLSVTYMVKPLPRFATCSFIHSFFPLLAVLSLLLHVCAVSRCGCRALPCSCSAQTPHCGVVSFCGAQALGRAGFRRCGSWPQWLHFQALEHRPKDCGTGLVALGHVGCSWTREGTWVSYIGRQIL